MKCFFGKNSCLQAKRVLGMALPALPAILCLDLDITIQCIVKPAV